MAERDKGRILRDKNVSLPRTEDFYYNDLAGNNYTKLTKDNVFYVEDPPENEDWMGFSADKALLSIKATKDAFKISDPYIATNSITGCNVLLDISDGKITWPDSSDITQEINNLRNRTAFDIYRVQSGGEENEKTWIKNAIDLRLLFFNPPAIPSFTTSMLSYDKNQEASHIFSKKFSEIKNNGYIYCKKPYPYERTVKTDPNGNEQTFISFSKPKYEDSNYGYKDDDILWFTTDFGNTPRQVIKLNKVTNGNSVQQQILLLNQDNSNPLTVADGYKAKDLFIQKIKEAQDIRIVFDTNTMSSQDASVYTQKYPLLYGDNLGPLDKTVNYVKALGNSIFGDQWYATVGYNAYGLDKFKRTHGVVYVKLKNPNQINAAKQNQEYVWWNLNKYIIYELGKSAESNNAPEVNKRYHVEYGPTQLKPYSYDYANQYYVDAFWKDALKNDEIRLAAQKEVFKSNSDLLPSLDSQSFDQILYEWTVTLGDVTFFVPPESIRVISQTSTSRVPIMRARGAVAKGTEKSQQFYELSVFFNEDRGINGVPYTVKSPNGKNEFSYKMNGFRALLAEMKFVPFVPIINKTFNEVFNVFAVCFENLSVTTVPGFPKLLKATIELSKFNYQVYMPEIPSEGYKTDGVYYNPFSCCINYDTLRYYYQKPILLGDLLDIKLRDKKYPISVNSYEFYTKTIFSNRTALLPCHFDDPTLRVYIANENHLMELDKIKKALLARQMDPSNRYDAEGNIQTVNVSSNYVPNDAEKRLIKDASTFLDTVDITNLYKESVDSIKDLAEAINTPGKQVGRFQILQDGISVKETVNGKETTVKYDCDSEQDINNFMNKYFYQPLTDKIKNTVKDAKNSQGEPLIKSVALDNNQQLNIEFTIGNYISSYRDFSNTQQEVSSYIASTNTPTIETKEIFSDTSLHLQMAKYNGENYLSGKDKGAKDIRISKLNTVIKKFSNSIIDGKIDIGIDKNQGLLFLDWCKNQGFQIAEANERTSELKQSMDLETIHTLKYDLLIDTALNSDTTAPADRNAIVQQFSATIGNTYARTSVSGTDGTAPQYMGSQDAHISFVIETTSEEIAGKFKSLPELVSYFNRTYRHVLSTYPVKIDSDFTRMLGITEIMIDSVAVDTVPNFPGLFRISVMATSVDRTLRNKEALKALDVKNQTLDISRLLKYRQSVEVKNYEKLDAELCKAEIYPDLELPTCTELGELGFRYIRYKDKERDANNFYVDPDFYFVYPAITYGRVLLEALQYSFASNIPEGDLSQFVADTSGAVQEVDGKTQLLKPGTENAQLKKQIEDIATMERKQAEDDPIYHLGGDKAMIFKIPFGAWNLGTKLRSSFMEPYYIDEYSRIDNKNDNTVYRIMVDGKTEAAIKKEKSVVDSKYKTIELYSEKEKTIKGTEVNENNVTRQRTWQRIEDTKKCAQEIKQWLKNNQISATLSSVTKKQASEEANEYDDIQSLESYYNEQMIQAVRIFFETSEVTNLLKKAFMIGDGVKSNFYDHIAKIIVATADARSSKIEFNQSSKDSNDWRARFSIPDKPLTTEEEIDFKLKERFGVFGIKRYTEADILRVLPSTDIDDFKKEVGKLTEEERKERGAYYLLDPYYRFKSIKEQREYLTACMQNYNYAALAFTRIVLWYLATLMELNIFPSVEYDIKRQDCLNMFEAELKGKETVDAIIAEQDDGIELDGKTKNKINQIANNNGQQNTAILINGMKEFVKNNGQPLDEGKFFVASILAMLGEPFRQGSIFDLIKNRNYDGLNGLVKSLVSVKYRKRNEADPTYMDRAPLMRKYILALYGHEIIDSIHDIGEAKDVSPSAQYLTDYNTKMALLAASNPARYMRDSFYDAVRNDYRGRMLRAFPTFYMIFIDEGREIGLFKLHDNFYNINAIYEIQVVKSRVLAADTCTITMSNMFQTFTTNDEDCTVNYKGGLGDLWESFWRPYESAQRAEELRILAADKINRAKLQPGIRIHVRVGYGANARDLPVVFNGTISEIQGNEMVKVIAQGDGIELCNPLYEQEDADVVKNNDIRFTLDSAVCGAPPKVILQSFLTAKGGCIAASLRGRYRGSDMNAYGKDAATQLRKLNADVAKKYQNSGILDTEEMNLMVTQTGDDLWGTINRVLLKYFPDNPYGIFHFGDPDYTSIFSQGEPAQNLYEITTSKEKVSSAEVENNIKLIEYFKNPNKPDESAQKTEVTQDDFAYFGDAALDLNTEIESGLGYVNNKDNLMYISFKPFGKTLWEIMHICQSVAPDWMTGVRDFGFRSTIFLGKPHYYYAYDYKRNQDSKTWIEKRKPYQQWHMYNSSYDIIKNNISASSDIVKTNAVGLYEIEGTSSVQKTEPMWVDQDIYPEYQRSSIVNTNYFGKSYWIHGPAGRTISVLTKGVGAMIGAAMGAISPIPGGAYVGAGVGGLAGHGIGMLVNDIAAYVTNNLLDKHAETWFDETGAVHSHEKIAAKMTINALKDSMRQMYQGHMIVIGDPSVKPQDRICVEDAYEDMEGMFEVREVIHQLSPETGFTTTITPDLISAYEPRCELAKTNGLAHLAANVAIGATAGVIYTRYIQRMDKVGGSHYSEILKVIKEAKLSEKGKSVSDVFKKAVELYNKGLKSENIIIKNILFQKSAQHLLGIKDAIQLGKGGYDVLSKMATAAPIPFARALRIFGSKAFILMEIALAGINSYVYRQVRNSQVLTLFPMKKFGKILAAGVDGSEGLLYGATSYNNPGAIEKFFARFLSGDSAKDASGGEKVAKWIADVFFDEDIKNEAQKYQRNTEFVRNAIFDPYNLKEEQLQSISKSQLDKAMYQPKTAYAMSLIPRCTYDNTSKTSRNLIKNALKNQTYVENIQDWIVDPNLKNLYHLPTDIKLERVFNTNFMRLIQDEKVKNSKLGLDSPEFQVYSCFDREGRAINVIALKRKEGRKNRDDETILDVPYLSNDGRIVLASFCDFVLSKLMNKPDDNEIRQAAKDTFLILESALQVGSENPIYRSGYHFILSGTGKLESGETSIKHLAEEFRKDLEKKLEDSKTSFKPCFQIDEKITGDKIVGITVLPASPYGDTIKKKEEKQNKTTGTNDIKKGT